MMSERRSVSWKWFCITKYFVDMHRRKTFGFSLWLSNCFMKILRFSLWRLRQTHLSLTHLAMKVATGAQDCWVACTSCLVIMSSRLLGVACIWCSGSISMSFVNPAFWKHSCAVQKCAAQPLHVSNNEPKPSPVSLTYTWHMYTLAGLHNLSSV